MLLKKHSVNTFVLRKQKNHRDEAASDSWAVRFERGRAPPPASLWNNRSRDWVGWSCLGRLSGYQSIATFSGHHSSADRSWWRDTIRCETRREGEIFGILHSWGQRIRPCTCGFAWRSDYREFVLYASLMGGLRENQDRSTNASRVRAHPVGSGFDARRMGGGYSGAAVFATSRQLPHPWYLVGVDLRRCIGQPLSAASSSSQCGAIRSLRAC